MIVDLKRLSCPPRCAERYLVSGQKTIFSLHYPRTISLGARKQEGQEVAKSLSSHWRPFVLPLRENRRNIRDRPRSFLVVLVSLLARHLGGQFLKLPVIRHGPPVFHVRLSDAQLAQPRLGGGFHFRTCMSPSGMKWPISLHNTNDRVRGIPSSQQPLAEVRLWSGSAGRPPDREANRRHHPCSPRRSPLPAGNGGAAGAASRDRENVRSRSPRSYASVC
jgi:hypothetical protein